MSNLIRCYKELIRLKAFEERYEYLRLGGIVGESTFGFDRWLNQLLYSSSEWNKIRNKIIIRDNGCDLGVEGYDVHNRIIVHHMNPLIIEDVRNVSPDIFNEEYLISCSQRTHNAIHYGNSNLLPKGPIERRPWDTCPWK